MVGYSPAFFTPRPVVALPWGSRSTKSVGRSASPSPAARLIAVVVLPTPPFWFTTVIVLLIGTLVKIRPKDSPHSSHHQITFVCSTRNTPRHMSRFHRKRRGPGSSRDSSDREPSGGSRPEPLDGDPLCSSEWPLFWRSARDQNPAGRHELACERQRLVEGASAAHRDGVERSSQSGRLLRTGVDHLRSAET